jgi:transposase
MTSLPFPALTGSVTTKIYLACGTTDMRKGFDGLAVLVQQVLAQSPHCGAIFAFRGKRGDLVKLLWYDGQGMCLFSKRMDEQHSHHGVMASSEWSVYLAGDQRGFCAPHDRAAFDVVGGD